MHAWRIVPFVLLSLTAVASAQESLDEIDNQAKSNSQAKSSGSSSGESKKPIAEVNGYIDNRFQYTLVNPNAVPSLALDPDTFPSSAVDIPSLQEILEGNIQLKVNLGSKAFFYTDLSVFYQSGWLYYNRDGMGGRKIFPEHDVAALHPFVVLSELYVTYSPKPWLNILLGKKRVVWGPGFAFNPADLVNPPKDPTDPNFQRAGQWLARVELPFEKFTVSTLFAPQVLYTSNGIPYTFMKFPDYPSVTEPNTIQDDNYHYLLAARVYALLFNSDLNLYYIFANKFNNTQANASRLGASFSRYFFTDYELHVEALLQFGNGRLYPDHSCAIGTFCNPATALSASKVDGTSVFPRVLVGGRTIFKDESLLSIEYYYQADGFSALEFEDVVRLISRFPPTRASSQVSGGSSGALPQRFSFDPLRRHYLIISYSKPKIKDDWTIGATLIAGLEDLSGTFSASVSWNVREWLNLSLFGFVPIHGIPVGTVTVNDVSYSEFGLTPFDFRMLFEAKAFY